MMFGKNEGKPVDVIAVEHTYVDGKLLERGTIVREMDYELALELASAGKVRKATEADIEAAKKARKPKAADGAASGDSSAGGSAGGQQ